MNRSGAGQPMNTVATARLSSCQTPPMTRRSRVVRRCRNGASGHARPQSTPHRLGAAFFRGEFATAIAGIALDVNPFDDQMCAMRSHAPALLALGDPLPVTPPLVERDGVLGRSHRNADIDPTGTFVAILDYLPQDADRATAVAHVRAAIDTAPRPPPRTLGPRYLTHGSFTRAGTNPAAVLC